MECKKCKKVYDVNLNICPFCGYQDENDIPHFSNPQEKVVQEGNTSSIMLVLIIIIICSIGYIVYTNFIKKDNYETELLNNDITIEYKSKGYSFFDLSIKDLDSFDLINSNYSYVDSSNVDPKSLCNLYNVSVEIDDGSIIIMGDNYSKRVNNILNAKYVTSYHKSACECKDFNIVVLTKDGKAFIYESEKIEFDDEREMIDNIALNFNEIISDEPISAIAITSYVGEINPCGEKVLLMVNNKNEKNIYRKGNIKSIIATYSYIIHNIILKDGVNYSLYINTDRTMIFADEYSEEIPLLRDEANNTIKFAGSFKDKNSDLMYVLSIDGLLYKLDLNKDINNMMLEHTKYGIVNDIAYKYDSHSNTTTYLFLFNDGSKQEFVGDFETNGVFSVR